MMGARSGLAAVAAAVAVMASNGAALALPTDPSDYRTPNSWRLRPAGTSVETRRAPDGLALSPDAGTLYAVNAGQADEALTTIDAATMLPTHSLTSVLYMGVAADADGDVWASGGARNKVWHYATLPKLPVSVGTTHFEPFPHQSEPNLGIDAVGEPAAMLLDNPNGPSPHYLYVAGNLAEPKGNADKIVGAGRATACADSRVCSFVTVIDVSAADASKARPVRAIAVGRDAYGMVMRRSATGGPDKLYVTNWADEVNPARAGGAGTVSVVDVSQPGQERETAVIPVGHHPTGIALSPDNKRLVVTNSADDTVSVIELDGKGARPTSTETFSVKPTDDQPRGTTPVAAGYSADGQQLFVALAGVNAIEVRRPNGAAVHQRIDGRPVPHTYIPAGWYPDQLLVGRHPTDPASTRLYVSNLKGSGSGPGFNELLNGQRSEGTVQAIDLPKAPGALAVKLTDWTRAVIANNGWQAMFSRAESPADDPCLPAPLPNGETSSSSVLCDAADGRVDSRQFHVVYIIKENKSFDQYFGDIRATLPDADGSPHWLLYGRNVTTNQHQIAEQFSVSDNFWADSEQSTLGHSWTSAGYATEFNELTWNSSGGYEAGLRGDPWNGQTAGQPTTGDDRAEIEKGQDELERPAGRLVDEFADPARNPNGATFRIYSSDVEPGTPAAAEQIDLDYWGMKQGVVRGRDLTFPDTDRANLFLRGETISHAWNGCPDTEGVCTGPPNPPPPTYGRRITLPRSQERFTLKAWTHDFNACRDAGGDEALCQRKMPNFLYMALPVDHTFAFNPGQPAPQSMVADNDYAVGKIVAGLSRSPFWKNTLVFVTEDDTQASGDHVDSHRTFLLAAGGLARQHGKQGAASHQAGSFPSVLKTVEVMFGLPPLTIYDRNAVPLHDLLVPGVNTRTTEKYTAVRPPTPFLRTDEMHVPDQLQRMSKRLDWRTLDSGDPYMLRDLLYAGIRHWKLPSATRRALAPRHRHHHR